MISGSDITVYRKGDIIFVPFPFTDLSATKTRPAVIISEEKFQQETGNLIAAMITSVPHATSYDYEIKDWKKANLLSPSWVRVKLATLDPSIVRYKPGMLTQDDLQHVEKKIQLALNSQS